MLKNEAITMARWAAGLFNGVSKEQTEYLSEVLEKYPKNLAEATIKTHRGVHEFLDVPGLLTGLRAAAESNAVRKAEYENETIVQYFNRTMPTTYPASQGDYATIAKMAQDDAAAVRGANPDGEMVLCMVKAKCLNACQQCGFTETEAAEIAKECIGPVPSKVDFLRGAA